MTFAKIMKSYNILLLIVIPWFVSCEKEEQKVDPVAGRPMIELDEGVPYILHTKNGAFQIELTIQKHGYGMVQLSNDGTGEPPVMVYAEKNRIATSRTLIEQQGETKKTSVISDEDGLPESRMITHWRNGAMTRIKREDLSVQFKTTVERIMDENKKSEQGAAGNPLPAE